MKFAFLAGALVIAFPGLAIGQIAILHIKITDGEGTVHAAGSRSAHPLTVEITDESGKPVSGAAVSFRLPEDGPGGLFANGLRTDLAITDANGRAAVRNLQLNRSPGAFQVRITASKEQARAGTLVRQYIAGTETREGQAPAAKAKSSKKWVILALVAAGAAGGVGAGVAGKSAPAKQTAPSPPTLSIGSPTIVVGKP